MSQFITQMGDDLATTDVSKLTSEDRQYIFESLADFFRKNAKAFNPEEQVDGEKIQIIVNIQVNPR